MSTKPTHASSGIPPAAAILPLATGDRLTRDQFEQRWAGMSGVKRAELIEGVVYMPTAIRLDEHGEPHALIVAWLTNYAARTPGVRAADNASVRLDLDNMPQPDGLLRIDEQHGGQPRCGEDGYLEGAPELVIEVSASSTSIDLHDKLHVYRRHGVREYLVWRVLERAVDWFALREGRFEPVSSPDDGVHRSAIFPGLWLDCQALLAGDGGRLFDVLQQGLDSREHAAFVERLSP